MLNDKDLVLMPLGMKVPYIQAIHTCIILMLDNVKELVRTDDVSEFRKVNRKQMLQLHNYILETFNYELSDRQLSVAVSVFYTFTDGIYLSRPDLPAPPENDQMMITLDDLKKIGFDIHSSGMEQYGDINIGTTNIYYHKDEEIGFEQEYLRMTSISGIDLLNMNVEQLSEFIELLRIANNENVQYIWGMTEKLNDNPYNLTDKQKLFCEHYAMGELRGHGVRSYAEAYGIDLSEQGAYNSCKVGASENLTKPNILSYIRDLFEDKDLNDTVVDNELAFVIKQNADFGSKVAAIKEYNQLKARIVKKLDITTKPQEIIISGQKFANNGESGTANT